MVSRSARFRAGQRCAVLAFFVLGLADLSCTGGSKDDPALQSLKQVIAEYEKATSYADSGELHVRMKNPAGKFTDVQPFPFSVTYERPNKLRLHARKISVVCDGKLLRATVPERPNHVLQVDAPAELTYANLFADETLDLAVRNGVGMPLVPLRLLLEDDPLGIGADDAPRPVKLEDGDVDGEPCGRIEVAGELGKTIYWIDRKTSALRRVDFPTAEIKKGLPDHISDVEIWAEFTGARLNEPIGEHAFEFEPPPNALLVKRFLAAEPKPLPPWLGARMPAFSFPDLEGKVVSRESLSGQVVVLDLWSTSCKACVVALPHLDRTYQKLKGNPKVAILAVSTDAADVDNKQLSDFFQKQGLHMPIVRDVENFTGKALGMPVLPLTVILGADASIQSIFPGFSAESAQQVPKNLDHLLAGGNIAQEAQAVYSAQRQKYQEQLQEAVVGKVETQEIPVSEVAERSEPTSLAITKLWTAEGLTHPGNLLAIVGEGPAKIVVLDGDRSVTELDEQGKVVARHDLDIPEKTAVNYLRTTVDGDGHRYYLAFAAGQQQFHLFDADWKRLLSYPDSEHAGLRDVQFADLDGNGQPEMYVGYWGVVGVQRVSLKGVRVKSNRDLEYVYRLAVTGPDENGHRSLLCATGADNLIVLDGALKKQRELRVPDSALSTIVAADIPRSKDTQLCGISAPEVGKTVAHGMQFDGKEISELWTYHLPDGLQRQPVEAIVCGGLRGDDSLQWLLPGADGSIHILSAADGERIDRFNYGSLLTGLAAATLEDDRVLLVCSTEGLTAWKVEPAKAASPESATESAAESDDAK